MRVLSVFLVCIVAVAFWWGWRIANEPTPMPTNLESVYGVAYTPNTKQDVERFVPEDGAIRDDLKFIGKKIDRIRLYSVTGAPARAAMFAQDIGLSVDLGVWIGADHQSNRGEIDALGRLLRDGYIADRVTVGNEAILRAEQSVETLLAYIAGIRTATDIPVGAAEPWHIWMDHPSLAKGVDFIGVQLLPYWEGIPVADAAAYAMTRLRALQAAYPGKPIVVTEIGWPSQGERIGGAIASRINQNRFLREATTLLASSGTPYFVIEAFDRPWKIKTEGLAGGYWGLWDADRNAKFDWRGAALERPDWSFWATGSVALGILLSVALGALRRLTPASFILTLIAQGVALTAMWSMMVLSARYATPFETFVWWLLIAAQWFLLLVFVIDGLEMTDRIWNRRRARSIKTTKEIHFQKISIHLPCCSEPPAMVCETLRALAGLDYPDFEVIVVDNNTHDPALWRPVAEFCDKLGERFKFHHIESLEGFKAGALNFAYSNTAPEAEYIAVIDSDYVVEPDWLLRTAPLLADPEVGFVQAPQDYRDGAQGMFKRFCLREYAAFFHIGMVRRDFFNAIIQHGVMTLIRRQALVDAGGWSGWCITEDAELGLRLHSRGWKSIFVPESMGRGLMPNDFGAYKSQRHRWVYGAMRILRRHWRLFVRPKGLSWAQRFQYAAGWLPWIADAAGLVFTIAAIFWTIVVCTWPETTSLPPWIFPATAIGVFCLRQARDQILYATCGPFGFWGRIGASFAGLALGYTIGRAVLIGACAKDRPFLRTPKDTTVKAPEFAAMAGGEAGMLLLLATVFAASVWRFNFMEADSWAWLGLLVVQSAPYCAAVVMAILGSIGRNRVPVLEAVSE
jgi:cellulose synthase/poly-beta-1,6-N-acetylglucosamine synthase-like glycosyltransferase/exo-beta-1,3-glucanase (GH17 family)